MAEKRVVVAATRINGKDKYTADEKLLAQVKQLKSRQG